MKTDHIAGSVKLYMETLVVLIFVFVLLSHGAFLRDATAASNDLTTPLIGVHSHLIRTAAFDNEYEQREESLRAIRGISFAYVRVDIPWKDVQPAPDAWRWDNLDSVVKLAQSQDIKILAVLLAPPDWAFPADRHITEWKKFLDALVARYGDTIKAWEIWNELNVPHFWPESSPLSGYVNILKTSYQIIKANSPDAVVVLAGMANNRTADGTWKMLISLGALNYCDAVGFHPYKLTGEQILPAYREIRDMMRPSGVVKPIWVTEYGWNTTTEGLKPFQELKVSDYKGQASKILKTYMAHAADGGGPFFVYEFRDMRGERLFGVVENDFKRKPAADAIFWITQKLGPAFSVSSEQVTRDGMIIDLKTAGGTRYLVTWGKEAYARVKTVMSGDKPLIPEVYFDLPGGTIPDKLERGDRFMCDQVVFWH
jgi:GH35 family endo-1,4-beta-xylanase